MALTLANADAVLKEFYLGPVREQLNQNAKFLAQLEKNSKDIQGKRALVPIHTTVNSGIGAITDGGALPDAGQQGYEDTLVPLKFNTGRFQVTGPTIRATKSDDGSFVRAVSSEMKGVVKNLRDDVNRQTFGDATGRIATFAVTASGDVLNLATTTTKTQMRQIRRGMKISVGTLANPIVTAASLTVVSVDLTNKTVTVTSGTGVVTAGTDFLFRKRASGAGNRELNGLTNIVAATGSLHGLDPASVPEWAAYVDTAGANRLLTEDKIQEVNDNVEVISGHTPDLWIGSYGVVRSFANQQSAKTRQVNTVALKAGWTGIELAATGSAFAKDKDAPENTAWALTTEVIEEYRMADFDFADYDGRSLRNTAGFDSWEGFVVADHEIATSERNAHAKVEKLSE